MHVLSTIISILGSGDGPDNEDGPDGGMITAIVFSFLAFGGIVVDVSFHFKQQ